jgi:hypothetical protein
MQPQTLEAHLAVTMLNWGLLLHVHMPREDSSVADYHRGDPKRHVHRQQRPKTAKPFCSLNA